VPLAPVVAMGLMLAVGLALLFGSRYARPRRLSAAPMWELVASHTERQLANSQIGARPAAAHCRIDRPRSRRLVMNVARRLAPEDGQSPPSPSRRSDAQASPQEATMPPAKSDRVRRHLIDRYIEPARATGQTTVGPLRSGDIALEVGLQHHLSLVCDAMTGPKLQRRAKVTVEVIATPSGDRGADLRVRYLVR
jgi:hypothetical protein